MAGRERDHPAAGGSDRGSEQEQANGQAGGYAPLIAQAPAPRQSPRKWPPWLWAPAAAFLTALLVAGVVWCVGNVPATLARYWAAPIGIVIAAALGVVGVVLSSQIQGLRERLKSLEDIVSPAKHALGQIQSLTSDPSRLRQEFEVLLKDALNDPEVCARVLDSPDHVGQQFRNCLQLALAAPEIRALLGDIVVGQLLERSDLLARLMESEILRKVNESAEEQRRFAVGLFRSLEEQASPPIRPRSPRESRPGPGHNR